MERENLMGRTDSVLAVTPTVAGVVNGPVGVAMVTVGGYLPPAPPPLVTATIPSYQTCAILA